MKRTTANIKNTWFYIVFFSIISFSIFVTYHQIVVLEQYHTFSIEDFDQEGNLLKNKRPSL